MLLNSRDFWTLPHLGCPALTQAFIQCTLPWLAPVGCPAALERRRSRPPAPLPRRRSRPPAPLPNPAGLQACACHQPHGTRMSLVLNEWNSPRLQTSREWQEGCGCRATLSLLYVRMLTLPKVACRVGAKPRLEATCMAKGAPLFVTLPGNSADSHSSKVRCANCR